MNAGRKGFGRVVLVLWHLWQEEQRRLVAMPTSAWILALPMVVLTGAIFAAVCLIGRAVGRGIRRLDRALAKRLPRWTTYLATGVVVVGLGFLVAEDVVVRGLIEFFNLR